VRLLEEAGFEAASIEPTRVYTRDDAVALMQGTGLDLALADQVAGKVMSAFVRATKPGGATSTTDRVAGAATAADAATRAAARAAKPRRDLATLGQAINDNGGGCGCGPQGCC
jgi:hypothetical protein